MSCGLHVGLLTGLIGGLALAADMESDAPATASVGRAVFVRAFAFDGNTVFSDAELSRVVASWAGREISSDELQEARRAVTLHYTDRGYLNSGAIIPEQDFRGGLVTIRVVEGRLTEIEVTGNRWLRDRFIEQRLEVGAGPPLDVNELRDRLQLLRQNPNIQQINAELQPGALPGEAHLAVRVIDERPFQLGLQVDNTRPPSVGAEQVLLLVGDRNLTGHSDVLEVGYGIAHRGADGFEFSAADNIGGAYTVPVTARDTTLRIYGSKNDYAIIEEPFDPLDITSESERYGVSLRHPMYRTANRELAGELTFERRQSQTFLLGEPFTLTPGAVNGGTDLSAIRFAQEWIDRSQHHVLAVRSTFSFGVDVFDTTDNGTDRDAKFWVWLGQFQYVRRLFNTTSQVILRADVQWTDEPLLALEQFTLGGANTVRGYRENQLVRDRGVYTGIELRFPVMLSKAGTPIVQLAPFLDFGAGWNVPADTPDPKTISSAGIGILFSPNEHLQAQLYWGHAFRDFHQSGDLQDAGIHFKVRSVAF